MALDPISNVASTGNANMQAAGINQEAFLKILLSQLTAQDPLKPMDNTQFVAQLAQFSQLEQSQQISTNVSNSIAIQTATQSVGLLSRSVNVSLNNGQSTSGTVTGIDFSGDAPKLTVTPSVGQPISGISLSQIYGVF